MTSQEQVKRIVIDYVLAKRQAEKSNPGIRADMDRLLECTLAFKENPFAELFLPAGEAYADMFEKRTAAIENTLLGAMGLVLMGIARGDAASIHSFNGSAAWRDMCNLLKEVDPKTARRVARVVAALLASASASIRDTELPPAPKFIL